MEKKRGSYKVHCFNFIVPYFIFNFIIFHKIEKPSILHSLFFFHLINNLLKESVYFKFRYIGEIIFILFPQVIGTQLNYSQKSLPPKF